jgi:hypothetical protein
LIKAGRAGSIPDDVTESNGPSQPLADFLEIYGRSVFNLNSIVVGLDAVANGYEKPESLDISWNPKDRDQASRLARKFAVEAILVCCSEALLQYIYAVAKLPRMREIRAGWDSETSKADKLRDIAHTVSGADHYLVPAAMLLVHWRNRVVHADSNAGLRHQEKQVLRKNEESIKEGYKNLSVDCLLCHFEEGRPTLKDISSLISMTINLAREIDLSIHAELTKEELDVWIEHYGLLPTIEKVRAETAPEKRWASTLRALKARAPKLLASYVRIYEEFSQVP